MGTMPADQADINEIGMLMTGTEAKPVTPRASEPVGQEVVSR
jgi:hypothetical protein